MSIVEALIEQIRHETRGYPAKRVSVIRLRIGALRQVVPETLTFCFAAATRDTDLAGATLDLESVPARVRCRQCRAEFVVADNWFQCPDCTAADGDLLTGNELDLTGIDLTEPCPA